MTSLTPERRAEIEEYDVNDLFAELHRFCNVRDDILAALADAEREVERLRQDRNSQQRVCIKEMEKNQRLAGEVEKPVCPECGLPLDNGGHPCFGAAYYESLPVITPKEAPNDTDE